MGKIFHLVRTPGTKTNISSSDKLLSKPTREDRSNSFGATRDLRRRRAALAVPGRQQLARLRRRPGDEAPRGRERHLGANVRNRKTEPKQAEQ